MRQYWLLLALILCAVPISTFFSQVIAEPTQIGINTDNPAPNVSLHIVDGFEAIRLDGSSPFISFYNGADYRGYLWMTGDDMYLINQKSGRISFGTNGSSDMTLSNTGDVGIGTTQPQRKLHVRESLLSGGQFNLNTIAGFEKGAGNAYLSILTDDSYQSGILFGDQLSAEDGGIIYDHVTRHMDLRTNGNIDRVTIDDQGDVGIARTNPLRPLHVKSRNGGDEYGIMIERSGSSVDWEMSVFGGNFCWFYDGETIPTARILTDGTYQSSDRRLKRNLNHYPEVLGKLGQFNVYQYEFNKSSVIDKQSIGLIAQEVAPLFPEMVILTPDRAGTMTYSLDYSKTGVIALKAIQEQQAIIDSQQEKIKSLEKKMTLLQEAVDKLQSSVADED